MTDSSATKTTSNPTPAHRLLSLVFGAATGQLVSVAAELGIANLLGDGPKTVEQLADATNTNLHALKSVIRALISLGVFQHTETGAVELNELGEILKADKPETLGKYAVVANRDCYHKMWSNLLHTVKTGDSAFDDVHGMNIYEFYEENPDELMLFQQALTGQTFREATAIRDAYDFAGLESLVDVGGGRGFLLQMILDNNPALHGTVFDMGVVTAGVENEFAKAGLADRSRVVSGDFFQELPEGGDLYIFKRIFIDKSDEQAVQLLKNCRSVIKPQGRVLIADPDIGTAYGKVFDVFMLGLFGAGIRTEEEWRPIFANSGFRFARSIDTDSTLMLIEAEAV